MLHAATRYHCSYLNCAPSKTRHVQDGTCHDKADMPVWLQAWQRPHADACAHLYVDGSAATVAVRLC